ncbi:hypothetical protein NOV72_04059 [Caballeronia novacaledonica]|uniref:DUF2029 domain-containing protein n=1 Tax=Caballeronia novacaledonica TaxID=1544861 RepID=A0A2U3I9R8_9BURK|nr:hypothetical protein [Caballeronia novacaledonica]SPB16859.1 hypothetical protein NOV72_04059 [Caballeronia novacaledonica]
MSQTDVPASSSWTARLKSPDLNASRTSALALVFVPVFFGLYSLWLGADANWDLLNYHLYDPFAWINGKLSIDFAPAGMQSFFNPMLDVGMYWLNTHLPSRAVGFAMGALHGLVFVLLFHIARFAVPRRAAEDVNRVPLLLALAGSLSASFLTGLGNSMGDDSTAFFSLASLLLLLRNWDALSAVRMRAWLILIGSGVVCGLGVGFKLTNAIFAAALCVALLGYPASLGARVRLAFLFGVGSLAGFAVTGGYWLFHMWQLFGNPFFPLFAKWFPNPLTVPITGDVRWLPRNLLETVLWPFVFAADPKRVGEVPVRQIVWPVVYAVFWIWVAVCIVRKLRGRVALRLDARSRFVVVYVAFGYLAWMKGFSIYRYLVAVEVLTPIVTFVLLQRLFEYEPARRLAFWVIGGAVVVTVAGGVRNWGHEGWADPLYHAELPTLGDPARTTAIIYSPDTAWSWLATRFPADVAFTQIESSFPRGPAFEERVRELVRSRGGPAFAIIDGSYNGRIDTLARTNAILDGLGLTLGARGCGALRWAVDRLHLRASFHDDATGPKRCHLDLRSDDVRDIAAENRFLAERAVPAFERNGFTLDTASCERHRSGIGKGVYVYQWCRVTLP